MTTLQTLKAARAKIADETNWTKGEFARSADNRRVSPIAPAAAKFCMMGAIRNVCRDSDTRSYAYDALGQCGFIGVFNDTHTHAEVLALFDKAIASLETKEAA